MFTWQLLEVSAEKGKVPLFRFTRNKGKQVRMRSIDIDKSSPKLFTYSLQKAFCVCT